MESKLIPKRFKVTNFRNIDDSGWIPLERVTALELLGGSDETESE